MCVRVYVWQRSRPKCRFCGSGGGGVDGGGGDGRLVVVRAALEPGRGR